MEFKNKAKIFFSISGGFDGSKHFELQRSGKTIHGTNIHPFQKLAAAFALLN